MPRRAPKPPILKSKRGVAILLLVLALIFGLLYFGVGATAFLAVALRDQPSQLRGAVVLQESVRVLDVGGLLFRREHPQGFVRHFRRCFGFR